MNSLSPIATGEARKQAPSAYKELTLEQVLAANDPNAPEEQRTCSRSLTAEERKAAKTEKLRKDILEAQVQRATVLAEIDAKAKANGGTLIFADNKDIRRAAADAIQDRASVYEYWGARYVVGAINVVKVVATALQMSCSLTDSGLFHPQRFSNIADGLAPDIEQDTVNPDTAPEVLDVPDQPDVFQDTPEECNECVAPDVLETVDVPENEPDTSETEPDIADVKPDVVEVFVPDEQETIEDEGISSPEEDKDIPDTALPTDVAPEVPNEDVQPEMFSDIPMDVSIDQGGQDIEPEIVPVDAQTYYCATAPSAFDLVQPANNAPWIIKDGLTLKWNPSTDPDQGDQVIYEVLLATKEDFSDQATLPANTATELAIAVDYGTTYYWKVVARDLCLPSNTSESPVRSFTVEKECVPKTISEAAFVSGILNNVDNETLPGNIMLKRNWDGGWNATSGILPSEAIPSWALVNTNGAPAPTIGIDPITGEQAVHIDTFTNDVNGLLYYEINPALNNTTGWAVQARGRMEDTQSSIGTKSGDDCSIRVVDGTKVGYAGLLPQKVWDYNTQTSSGPFDTQSSSHTYRLEGKSGKVNVYADETLIFTDVSYTVSISPSIRFGDNAITDDGNSFWNHIYYSAMGNKVPFVSPGTYSRVFDTLGGYNNFGSGATLNANVTTVTGTSIIIETRSGTPASTGDACDPAESFWSPWTNLSGNQISSPSARCLETRFTLTTEDAVNLSPKLADFVINYCDY